MGSTKQSQIQGFQETLKIALSCIDKFYRVSAIPTNTHTCLNKVNVSEYFVTDPLLH